LLLVGWQVFAHLRQVKDRGVYGSWLVADPPVVILVIVAALEIILTNGVELEGCSILQIQTGRYREGEASTGACGCGLCHESTVPSWWLLGCEIKPLLEVILQEGLCSVS
jgi:hypothetical protein